MDVFNELDASVDKLGRTFFLGRKKVLAQAKESLRKASQYCEFLQGNSATLKTDLERASLYCGSLKKDNTMLKTEKKELQKAIDDNEIKLRNFELVSDALRARPVKNEFITQFHNLIYKDFVAFCDKEPNLNDTPQFQELRRIETEMQLIANCPALHSRSLGALGGGFSSGKSSFLNSFLTGAKVRLAEGLQPVTAIPSYIICDDESKVQGITYKGGCFDISLEMYKSISHKFLESFTFNLNEIILYTTVLTPMEKSFFDNLCLIDTPGYNAPSVNTAEKDLEIAREYIKDVQFLIWMVGLDSSGTISKSDLDFLESLDFGKKEEKELYIVATKAEIKTEEDIKDILDDFEDCLDDRDLQYAGISAYSSKTKKIYASRKTDIHSFLAAHNKPGTKYETIKTILDDVFSSYIAMITGDFNEKESKRKEVKRLLLDALESGHIDIDESSSALQDGLNGLIRYFQSDESLEQRLDRAKKTRMLFEDCFHGFCDMMGIKRIEYVFCTQCGKQLKKTAQFCTECGKRL